MYRDYLHLTTRRVKQDADFDMKSSLFIGC